MLTPSLKRLLFKPEALIQIKGSDLNAIIQVEMEESATAATIKAIELCTREFANRGDSAEWISIKETKKLAEASKTTLRKAFIEDGPPIEGENTFHTPKHTIQSL